MGETEITIFIILANLILLIFVSGIFVFVFQYRKRKLLHQKEKANIEKQFQLDLLDTQLQIQHETMHFIGREIHDSVGQKLTLAAIYSQKLEFENPGAVISADLARISTIINDSLSELRDLSHTLTQSSPDAALADLLQAECARINAAGLCRASLHSDLRVEPGMGIKTVLLRVLQEFIQNSLKHSGCKHISVFLSQAAEGMSIAATDDGKGFDPGQPSPGMGLANMKSRIQAIGGSFRLTSEKSKGTRLDLFFPQQTIHLE